MLMPMIFDDNFIEQMRECGNIKATRLWMRINCLMSIRDLLGLIGEQWRPLGFMETIPGVYFEKAYRLYKVA